ncbi:hypothetical protein BDN67DRAFT_1059908, partial [Paxillus ammoniavirescens]
MHVVWAKNCTALRVLDGKTPYELLHGKRPNLANLPCWGTRVWVHDPTGSKLNMRAHEGYWVGFDAESGGHRVHLADRRTVAVKRNISFEKREGVVLGPGDSQIEGERNQSENRLRVKDDAPGGQLDIPQPLDNPEQPTPLPQTTPKAPDPTSTQPAPTLRRSSRQRMESPYMRMLHDHIGMHDGRGGDPIFPRGIQSVEESREAKGDSAGGLADASAKWEMEDSGEAAYAMFAGTGEAEAWEPRTVDKARTQPDWPR